MKISIITVSYNSEKTIEETIRSVIQQKNQNVEYIIIDGKSTDGTLDIVEKYKNYIDKIISEPDRGVSDAFNKGIKNSTGDIIGIINSDDVLYRGAIDWVFRSFEEYRNIDVLYGDIRVFTDDMDMGYVVKANTDLTKLRYAFLLPHPSIFITRAAYKKYGLYSLKLKNAMDYELISRMYNRGAQFYYVDAILAGFREGGISQTGLSRTLIEHRTVARRNGASLIETERYLMHVFLRRKMAPVLKKLRIENKLHHMIENYENIL